MSTFDIMKTLDDDVRWRDLMFQLQGRGIPEYVVDSAIRALVEAILESVRRSYEQD